MNMLEFTKKILKAVSFDAKLFQKELVKAIHRLTEYEELKAFQQWCIHEFGKVYPAIIQQEFKRELMPAPIKRD